MDMHSYKKKILAKLLILFNLARIELNFNIMHFSLLLANCMD
jgi:hypothetical protein